ncbi:MAG: OsmC family protein [Acidobacteria bacterium]|nr:OsmC family protein [Acidobacteriota bacterium]
MSNIVHEFSISVDREDGYVFRTAFDKPQYPQLVMDEPPPLGRDSAPNPARILAAAVGNCLAASLLFCATRKRAVVGKIHAGVKVTIGRNENKRLRVAGIQVLLSPEVDPATLEQARGCLGLFEEFCTVTASIREGIPVEVKVAGWEAIY